MSQPSPAVPGSPCSSQSQDGPWTPGLSDRWVIEDTLLGKLRLRWRTGEELGCLACTTDAASQTGHVESGGCAELVGIKCFLCSKTPSRGILTLPVSSSQYFCSQECAQVVFLRETAEISVRQARKVLQRKRDREGSPTPIPYPELSSDDESTIDAKLDVRHLHL